MVSWSNSPAEFLRFYLFKIVSDDRNVHPIMATGGTCEDICESNCSHCEEPLNVECSFKCLQCNLTDGTSKPPEIFCDTCITVIHVKKGHQIVDNRNLEPAICSEHKQLCLDYCKSCEELICTKCLRLHRKHDSVPLTEKGSEVRREVFELLSEWEKNEKKAIKTAESILVVVGNHEKDASALIQNIEELLDQAKKSITEKIRAKLNGFKEIENKSKERVETIGKTQTDLRCLLGVSTGTMISQFPIVKTNIEALKETDGNIDGLQLTHSKFEELKDFETLSQDLILQIISALKLSSLFSENKDSESPQTPKVANSKLIIGIFDDNCFEVEQRNEIVTYRTIDFGNNEARKTRASQRKTRASQRFEQEMVKNVYWIADMTIIVLSNIINGSKRALRISECDPFFRQISYPSELEVLEPYVHKSGDSTVEWLCWDEALKQIRRWNMSLFQIGSVLATLRSKPLNTSITSVNFVCFYDRDAQTIVTLDGDMQIWGKLNHEYAESIDSIYTFFLRKELALLTYSSESKSSSVYLRTRLKSPKKSWLYCKRINWNVYEMPVEYPRFVIRHIASTENDKKVSKNLILLCDY